MTSHPNRSRRDNLAANPIWDGEVVRSRVLRLSFGDRFEAKCKCKRWIPLPVKIIAKTP